MVGMPAPKAQGSAVAYALGEHTGERRPGCFRCASIPLDGRERGGPGHLPLEGRRRRHLAPDRAWPHRKRRVELADGVMIKWISGVGGGFRPWRRVVDFGIPQLSGPSAASGRRPGHLVGIHQRSEAEQPQPGSGPGPQRVRAFVLADHNLGPTGPSAVLMADSRPQTGRDPEFSLSLDAGGSHHHRGFSGPKLPILEDIAVRFASNPEGLLKASLLSSGRLFRALPPVPPALFALSHRKPRTHRHRLRQKSRRGLRPGPEPFPFLRPAKRRRPGRVQGACSSAVHHSQSGRLKAFVFHPLCGLGAFGHRSIACPEPA